MGWTYFNSRGRDVATILQSENPDLVWVAHTIVGEVLYAVVDNANLPVTDYVCDADGASRSIIVFLLDRCAGEEPDFGYRDIHETDGPYVATCPARLIGIASPFLPGHGGFGLEWRIACLTGKKHL